MACARPPSLSCLSFPLRLLPPHLPSPLSILSPYAQPLAPLASRFTVVSALVVGGADSRDVERHSGTNMAATTMATTETKRCGMAAHPMGWRSRRVSRSVRIEEDSTPLPDIPFSLCSQITRCLCFMFCMVFYPWTSVL